MATTLSEIEGRLLTVMPTESTIDRALHARAVASVVIEARRRTVAQTRQHIATTRSHVDTRGEWIRLLKDRMREHGE